MKSSTCRELLQAPPDKRDSHWLSLTLEALEDCPLEIPEVFISHGQNSLPYLHCRIPKKDELGKVVLKKDVHSGLLDFGCGLAIHLPDEGTPAIRLRHGDLLWLKLSGTLIPPKENPLWGTPSAETYDPGDGSPKSGKIAHGASTLHPIPEDILPKSSQDTLLGFLEGTGAENMKIRLLKDPIQRKQSLALLTGLPIGGAFNPTPLIEALHWHCPAHYTWSAIANHEDEETN